MRKQGLSDIVTTALIILLVAVAVAAIWSFVAPALRSTGTQFTNTATCISNQVEPISCTHSVLNDAPVFPLEVRVRRTLSDNIAVLTQYETYAGSAPATMARAVSRIEGTYFMDDTTLNENIRFLYGQGEVIDLPMGFAGVSAGNLPEARVISKYRLHDSTEVTCISQPIVCLPR